MKPSEEQTANEGRDSGLIEWQFTPLRVIDACRVALGELRTDLDLLKASYGLYLIYTEKGKKELHELAHSECGELNLPDEDELLHDPKVNHILLKALKFHRKKSSLVSYHFSAVSKDKIQFILNQYLERSINASGSSFEELTDCRFGYHNEDDIEDLFHWVLANPSIVSDYLNTLPSPSKICEKPINTLNDPYDCLQAFYELAYGYSIRHAMEVLGVLIQFPSSQSKAQQKETLLKKINEFALYRSRYLELRKESSNLNQKTWLESFKFTLQMAFENAAPYSLRRLVINNNPPSWDLLVDLWQDFAEKQPDWFPKPSTSKGSNESTVNISTFPNSLGQPQRLHLLSIDELWGRPLNDRWQAVIEWVINPIVEESLQKGDVYPFPIGQSSLEQTQMVESYKQRGYRLNQKILPLWSEIDRTDSLIIDEYTRELYTRQTNISKANFENIKERLNAAKPGSYREQFSLAETLGVFGAEPLQDHFQRDEIYHRFLDEPPIFLTDAETAYNNDSTTINHQAEKPSLTKALEDVYVVLSFDREKTARVISEELKGSTPNQIGERLARLQVLGLAKKRQGRTAKNNVRVNYWLKVE